MLECLGTVKCGMGIGLGLRYQVYGQELRLESCLGLGLCKVLFHRSHQCQDETDGMSRYRLPGGRQDNRVGTALSKPERQHRSLILAILQCSYDRSRCLGGLED